MTAPANSIFQNGSGQVSADNLLTMTQWCPNVPTLRTFIGTATMNVYLLGSATVADGGQGPFYWNASGTGPDDGGATSVVPTGSTSGCWTRIPTTSSLPVITNNELLANISGSSTTPIGITLSAFIDSAIGSTQGGILYRGASLWSFLSAGTSGQVLESGGAAANPSWATVTGTGTVTSIGTNNGLVGGPITGAGTIGLASVSNNQLLANISGGSAAPSGNTVTAIIDSAIGNTQGGVLYRNASQWVLLNPGTSGQVLQTQGASANPQWATQSSLTLATKQATTSGTEIDFTGIPASVKRIVVCFTGVSTNGTSSYLIQIGSGSYTTTGYTSASSIVAASVASSSSTAGFLIRNTLASSLWNGSIVLSLLEASSNTWVVSGTLGDTAGPSTMIMGGAVALSGTLDRLRLTTVNGTDAFDAGAMNIVYE